jgi:hypothetical protein
MKSIQDSFQALRMGFQWILAGLIITLISAFIGMIYILKNANQRVYIISPHQTYMANASFDHEVSLYEARNMVKLFCENLFSWDKDNFNSHMELALNLIDHPDGLKLFNTFKQNEVYENLITTSAKVSIQMDSIQLDMNSIPIQGIFYVNQIWQSVGGTQSQKIKARFELIPVSRTELDPYGLLIQKIAFLEYNIGKNENRDSISKVHSNP